MSGGPVSTKSPTMLRIREALEFHCARTGPISCLDIAALLRIREDVAYKYMRQLESERLAHVAAWRLEDSLTRFQDVPEFMPGAGPGYRAPKSSRSKRDLMERKSIVIETAGEVRGYVPIDTLSAIMSGVKRHAVEA